MIGKFWHWLLANARSVQPMLTARDLMPDQECAVHGYEPIPPEGAFKICVECGHAYLTAQELVDEHNRVLRELADAPPPWSQDPGVMRATRVRMQRLDERGQPVGAPIAMSDALVEISYTPFPIDMFKIVYAPITVDQVHLVTICPHCTHDF